jgi:hypothetical protein
MVWPCSLRKLEMMNKDRTKRATARTGFVYSLFAAGIWLAVSSAALGQEPGPPEAGSPPDDQRVSQRAEMEKLLTDQTLYGRYNPGGKPWTEYQSPDGRTAYKEENCTYAGHWWIQGDLVCYRYDSFNQGKPACFALFHQKDQLSFYIPGLNGEWFLNAYTTERRPGNPDRMPVEGQACVGV